MKLLFTVNLLHRSATMPRKQTLLFQCQKHPSSLPTAFEITGFRRTSSMPDHHDRNYWLFAEQLLVVVLRTSLRNTCDLRVRVRVVLIIVFPSQRALALMILDAGTLHGRSNDCNRKGSWVSFDQVRLIPHCSQPFRCRQLLDLSRYAAELRTDVRSFLRTTYGLVFVCELTNRLFSLTLSRTLLFEQFVSNDMEY